MPCLFPGISGLWELGLYFPSYTVGSLQALVFLPLYWLLAAAGMRGPISQG